VFLAQQAKQGDAQRFNELCERLMPALYGWASLRVGAKLRGRLEPDELVQQTWLRAVERFHSFDETRGSFRAWLFGIANYVLIEALRKATLAAPGRAGETSRIFPFDQAADAATSVSLRAARTEAMQRFLAHVAKLGEDDHKLVLLCGIEGLPVRETATVLGIGEEAAKKRWQRLRAELIQRGTPDDLLA
jgi:RNA polymerase sigma-70 factor (ECF subfamily)